MAGCAAATVAWRGVLSKLAYSTLGSDDGRKVCSSQPSIEYIAKQASHIDRELAWKEESNSTTLEATSQVQKRANFLAFLQSQGYNTLYCSYRGGKVIFFPFEITRHNNDILYIYVLI